MVWSGAWTGLGCAGLGWALLNEVRKCESESESGNTGVQGHRAASVRPSASGGGGVEVHSLWASGHIRTHDGLLNPSSDSTASASHDPLSPFTIRIKNSY